MRIDAESNLNAVAISYPQVVRRFSKELGTYLQKVGGQRPSFKSTGRPCPWPDEF